MAAVYRRSLRRAGNKKRNTEQYITEKDDPPGFMVQRFKKKGRGIVTLTKREKGDFLLNYKGEHIHGREGDTREENDSTGFRFFYKSNGKRLCVDASVENGSLGRLVNHGERKEQNCVMKEVHGHLCLFAMRDINIGEELLYDYGLKRLPWQQGPQGKSDHPKDDDMPCPQGQPSQPEITGSQDAQGPQGESDHPGDNDMTGPQEQPSQPEITESQDAQGPQGESDHPGDNDMTGPQEQPSQPEITESQDAQGPQGESDHPGDNDMTGPQEQPSQPEITEPQDAQGPQGESDHPGDNDMTGPQEQPSQPEISGSQDAQGSQGESDHPGDNDMTGPQEQPSQPEITESQDAQGPQGESDHPGDNDMPCPQGQPSQPEITGSQDAQGPQGESDRPGDNDMTGPQEQPSQPEITESQDAQGPQGESDHPGDNYMTGPQEQPSQPEITEPLNAQGPQGESDHPGDNYMTGPQEQPSQPEITESQDAQGPQGESDHPGDNDRTGPQEQPSQPEITESQDAKGPQGESDHPGDNDRTGPQEQPSQPEITESQDAKGPQGESDHPGDNDMTGPQEQPSQPEITESQDAQGPQGESDHPGDNDMTGPQEQPSQPEISGSQDAQGPQGESDHPGDNDMPCPQGQPSQPEITGSQDAQGPQGESDHPGDNDMTGPQEQPSQPEITGPLNAQGDAFAENDRGHIWGSVIVMKHGREISAFPMKSTVLGIGSARSNCIVVKGAAAHEVILEVNMHGEVFLVRAMQNNAEIHLLKDGESFDIGNHKFKWKNQECSLGEPRTNHLELESENNTSNDLDSESDHDTIDDFGTDLESNYETLDDSVNDPDFMIESDSSHSDVASNKCESDVLQDSSSDTSDVVPYLQDLPALNRKRPSLDILTEAQPKRRKTEKTQDEEDITLTSKSNLTSGVSVQAANNANGRKWDKKEYCLYCSKGSTNISKHCLKSHKTEVDVKTILDLPLKSKQRSQELMKIRRAGNYKHNIDVLKKGYGEIVVVARHSFETKPGDYLPCESCLGFFLKDSLWRHKQVCPFVKKGHKNRKVQSEATLLLPASIEITEGLKYNVVSKMASDDVTIASRNDRIIVKIGEKLYQKHGHLPHIRSHISQKMRELGRFLICAREHDLGIKCMTDILVPAKFPLALECARSLCKYNHVENCFGNPSLALKLGHLLKKCARLSKYESLINDDTEQVYKADSFLTLCEDQWTDEISSCALHTLTTKKMNKGQTLPLSNDIVKLQKYFDEQTKTLTETLEENFVKSDWELLNQMTLAELVVFNRRRGGETQRMNIKAYVSRKENSQCPPTEVINSLSETEKCLLKTLSRVEIRGKKGRTVPVLLPHKLQRNIDLLLRWRHEAGVAEENQYIFARPNFGSLEPLRSSDVLRYFAKEAGLMNPHHITSTKLRKHVATVAQVLKLDKHDLETMASFMGHDITVHRSFYRLPQETLQVARMGRLLTAFNNGTIGKYNGKSIDDIALDDIISQQKDFTHKAFVVENVPIQPVQSIVRSDADLSSDDSCDSDDDTMENREYITEAVCPGPSSKPPEINGPSSEPPEVDGPSSEPPEVDVSTKGKKQATKIQRLSEEQSQLLRKLFQTNIYTRRELKMIDCINVIKKYECLKELSWKKIKNTVHNWIVADKRKVKLV